MLLSFFWFKEGGCAFHTATGHASWAVLPWGVCRYSSDWLGTNSRRHLIQCTHSAGTSPRQASSTSTGPQPAQTGELVLTLEALALLTLRSEHHAAFHTCTLLCSHQPKPMSFHMPKDSSSPTISPCNMRVTLTLPHLPVSHCFIASILALGLEVSLEQGSWSPAVLQSARQNAVMTKSKIWEHNWHVQ